MFSQQVQYGSIEFQPIQNQYPLGENVYCYFIVPGTTQPEQGDMIGLVPLGWKNGSELRYKKFVKIDNVWGTVGQKFGHVMFESDMIPTIGQQQYQFVYVKNGGLVHGISKPFTFEPKIEYGQYMPYGQFTTGQRSYETGIQQWINKLKITVGGVYGEEFMTQQPHHIQYQHGLRYLQKGLEQVLLNELEGVKSMQQGLQHIQKYVTLVQVLPQTFHQEIRKIQQGAQGLEQIFLKHRQTQKLQQLIENVVFRQHVDNVQQGLQGLRKIVPVPVSVMVQEPIMLRTKIQEIFGDMPIESTWGQKSWEEVTYTIGKFLNEQEKLEQVQRELEHERILSHLKTLETVLLNQQRMDQCGRKEFLKYKIQKQIRDLENAENCDKYEQLLKEKIELDCEKRVVMRLKLAQILGDIMQQIKDLKLREKLHMTTFGQKLRFLMEKCEGKSMIELPTLKDLILDVVSGQVLSQVGLRGYYSELTGLLDEIECNLRELESVTKHFECKPEFEQEQVFLTTQRKQTPIEYKWWSEQTPIEKYGIDSELYTPSTFNTTGVPCMIKTTTVEGIYPTTQIEQLRRKLEELKTIKYGVEMKFNKFGGKVEQFETKFGQQYPTEIQTPCNFEKVLSQLKEIRLTTPTGLVSGSKKFGSIDTGLFGGMTQQGEEFLPEQILMTKVMTKKERQDKTIYGSYPVNRYNF